MNIKHELLKLIPDSIYLKNAYKKIMGKNLNLRTPKTFNEKLQWLKLHNRNPLYTTLVDKYAVKNWAARQIGDSYIIPTLGVWDKFEEIDFEKLPNQFVLKCTHDSGSYFICKDKSKLDKIEAQKRFTKALKRNFFYSGREWPYKNVHPRIIAEQYMEDRNGAFVDYKFSCFNGVVDCVMVCLDRHLNDVKFYFFDKDWNLKRLNVRGKNAPDDFTIPKPPCMDEMFEIAAKLSKDIPFVRVDLFECDGKIYFGEMTFYPDSGFDANLLPETDVYFGQKIDLSKITRR
ncbi:ATP-grasp fold amidoligase family protein [Fibrobacter sp. UWB12]|uniref:ATP-grasp fold amidoligase family protein n=1 Tax=Fibrobacter sp. UWB12 TaxID=1896203 RepID=UPI000932C6F7|nr:ATP-grasp fold amidoligase family protein [Fibrobacter sp. UWB12]